MNATKPLNWIIRVASPHAKSKVFSVCATVIAFTCLLVPAHSANSYAAGCKSYSQGDYKAAETFFKEAVATYPSNALVHYQLANTAMGLHKRVEAKAEYARCLQLNPDLSVASSCQKMLTYLTNSGASQSTTSAIAAQPTNPHPSAETEKEKRKQAILRQASAEAAAIRAEAAKMIAEGGAPGNQQLVRNSETGEVHIGVTSAQGEAIREEANARAEKVLVAGRDKALHL